MANLHLFAGANSPQGFFSYYQYLALDNYKRVYILKGGPGSGKSTIIKTVARHFSGPQERYHCTAAVGSLDGLVLPARLVSLVDGTLPHNLEPHLPGAVQQTIDLASFWDYRALAARRSQIGNLKEEIAWNYKAAYGWLAVAAAVAKQVQRLEQRRECPSLQTWLAAIIQVLPDKGEGLERKAFASGITGRGVVSFLPKLSAKVTIALRGGQRPVNDHILESVRRYLKLQNVPAHYLYCGFQPRHLEHIYIPGRFALISSHPPHEVSKADLVLGPEHPGLSATEAQCFAFIDKAVACIAAAAKLHAELEDCYQPCIDFQQISRWPQRLIAEIEDL